MTEFSNTEDDRYKELPVSPVYVCHNINNLLRFNVWHDYSYLCVQLYKQSYLCVQYTVVYTPLWKAHFCLTYCLSLVNSSKACST